MLFCYDKSPGKCYAVMNVPMIFQVSSFCFEMWHWLVSPSEEGTKKIKNKNNAPEVQKGSGSNDKLSFCNKHILGYSTSISE